MFVRSVALLYCFAFIALILVLLLFLQTATAAVSTNFAAIFEKKYEKAKKTKKKRWIYNKCDDTTTCDDVNEFAAQKQVMPSQCTARVQSDKIKMAKQNKKVPMKKIN